MVKMKMKNTTKRNSNNKSTLLIRLGVKLIILLMTAGFIFSGLLVIWFINLPLPDFDEYFKQKTSIESTKIYDRTGEILLFDVHDNIRRTVVNLSDISPNAIKATIAIEDAEFYEHKGVRIQSIIRAFLVNLRSGAVKQGGSTLTQQVVKNTLLTQEKKITRKIKEFIIALKVEQTMSKDDILELYFNETPYGGNIYGIQEASMVYFGKDAKDLTMAEAAYLAALPQAPTYFSPYGPNKDDLIERKNLVINKMLSLGFINEEEYEEISEEEVNFLPLSDRNIKAPHFVFYILDKVEKELDEDLLNTGGLKIITTLDWEYQQKAEELIKKHGDDNAEKFQAGNIGMVAINPQNGEIISMVGSRNYFDNEGEGNFNVTLAKRQPGSALKPFIYAEAFNKGYTPETTVFDLSTEFNVNCSPWSVPQKPGVTCYRPSNYDGSTVGPITFKNALAQSKNIPAVKVLYLSGLKDSLKLISNMGITTLTEPERYGLTLVLGGGEVTLLELSAGYGVFATEGLKYETSGIIKIEDNEGNIIKENKSTAEMVLPVNTARIISNILSDDEARAPVFGYRSRMYIPGREVAVKTGTTNNYRDAWIIGYTPNIVIGVWSGNNDNTPMDKRVAGYIVSPVWNELMTNYLSDKPVTSFNPPNIDYQNLKPIMRGIWQGGKIYHINKLSGKRATENTPEELREEKVITNIHSILYWIDKNDPLGLSPTNPENDNQFESWETPVRQWAALNGYVDEDESVIPSEYDEISNPENFPSIIPIVVEELENKDINIIFETESNFGIEKIEIFLNNYFITSLNPNLNEYYEFSFNPLNFIDQENLLNKKIEIIIYDKYKNKDTFTSSI